MEPIFLTLEEIIEIHADQIARYGGTAGIRDVMLLQSAVAMPQAGFGDRYLHVDRFEMAAAYLFHIVQNHPFVDGNKRVGAAAALVFLDSIRSISNLPTPLWFNLSLMSPKAAPAKQPSPSSSGKTPSRINAKLFSSSSMRFSLRH